MIFDVAPEAYYFMHGVVRQVLETLDSGAGIPEPSCRSEDFALWDLLFGFDSGITLWLSVFRHSDSS